MSVYQRSCLTNQGFMSKIKSFLGTGWGFPPTFSKKQHSVKMVSDAEDIRESLYLILSTTPGERVTNPEFGCGLQNLAFENIDSTTEFLMRDIIKQAVLYFEPRVTLESIDIDFSNEIEGVIYITLHYTIRKVNIRSNIVYPFYKLEGTLINDDEI